jgi:hypothetical protein
VMNEISYSMSSNLSTKSGVLQLLTASS